MFYFIQQRCCEYGRTFSSRWSICPVWGKALGHDVAECSDSDQFAAGFYSRKTQACEDVKACPRTDTKTLSRLCEKGYRGFDMDVEKIEEIFAPGEIDRIYLNFSDPWPPKGQHKRRLTHPAFLTVYQRFLKEEGDICFKTDNRPLFEPSICYFSQFGYGLFDVTFNLHATDTPNVMTEYERNFSLQGLPIYRLVARKMLPDTPRTDVRKVGQYDSKEEEEA